MSTQPQPRLTPEEYLARERAATEKSEYYAGEVFAMAGASYKHSLIGTNTLYELRSRSRAGTCSVLGSDMRVSTGPTGLYTYPDVVVVCGDPKFLDNQFDTLLNPVLIVEVLSPSTKDYDRGSKFELYRSIASLRDYLLIAQDRVYIEHHARQDERTWILTETNDPQGVIALPSLGVELPIGDIYTGLKF